MQEDYPNSLSLVLGPHSSTDRQSVRTYLKLIFLWRVENLANTSRWLNDYLALRAVFASSLSEDAPPCTIWAHALHKRFDLVSVRFRI